MGITIRPLSRNAAAYALLAVAPLAAYSQTAPAPETHGIVVANMDRSVKPATISTATRTAAGSSAPKSPPTVATLESSIP